MRFRQHVSGKSGRSVEGVGKAFLQILHGFLRGVDRDRTAVRRAEPPQIIEAHDVIRMRMRVDDSIQILKVFTKSLNPELGTGIHDPGSIIGLDIDRGPHSLIARIHGLADFARATNHGYTHGCPGAQKCDR